KYQACLVAHINRFALRLGWRIRRRDRDHQGVGRGKSRHHFASLLHLRLLFSRLALQSSDALGKLITLPPEPTCQQSKRGSRVPRRKRPPRTARRERGSMRFTSNCIQQSLASSHGRLGTANGHRHERHVSAQLLEFASAPGASLQMLFQQRPLLARQATQSEECEVLVELFVFAHGLKALRKASSPARMRVFMVPSGSPVLAAISVWVNPSK